MSVNVSPTSLWIRLGPVGLGRGERDRVGRVARLRADERALVEGPVEERERR